MRRQRTDAWSSRPGADGGGAGAEAENRRKWAGVMGRGQGAKGKWSRAGAGDKTHKRDGRRQVGTLTGHGTSGRNRDRVERAQGRCRGQEEDERGQEAGRYTKRRRKEKNKALGRVERAHCRCKGQRIVAEVRRERAGGKE